MPTALELIHTTAAIVGRFEQGVTTSVGTTQTLVCSKFANSVLSSAEFANFAVLIESGCCAGEMGMLTNAGLSTTTGTLTTADSFTQVIASGVAFSLYSRDRLPPYRQADKPGLLQKASESAERTWAEDTVSILGVSDLIHYVVDTVSWPWFTDDTRIIEIQRPVVNADDVPVVMSRNEWAWVSDGEIRKLRFPGKPFRTGETFTIKVNRPGNSRLKLNAAARAVLSTTTLGSVVVTAGGLYPNTPTATVSGGGGSGATVTVGCALTLISVRLGGTAYTFPPAVSITGGGGSGATAAATIADGRVVAVTLTAAGSGYTSTPTVTLSSGGGSGATAAVTLMTVTALAVPANGTGYTSTPSIAFSAADWTDQPTQTAGLVTLADEAITDVAIMRPMMAALAFMALAEIGAPGQTVNEWQQKASVWEGKAVAKKTERLPRDANEGVIRMRSSSLRGGPPGFSR